MDLKVKGIVLKAQDYQDDDKLLSILTLEEGKIIVKARGVKKAKSKLKAFCQPFCFADFELANSKGGGFVLTGVNEIENFFSLSSDIKKINYAFAVIEIVDKICQENESYPQIFVDILKCLKQISYTDTNSTLCLIKFILNTLNFEGVNLNLNRCNSCKSVLLSNVVLDLNTGEILCPACKNFNCIEISRAVFSALKMIGTCEYEKLHTIKLSQKILDEALKVIIQNLQYKFDIHIKTIELL